MVEPNKELTNKPKFTKVKLPESILDLADKLTDEEIRNIFFLTDDEIKEKRK